MRYSKYVGDISIDLEGEPEEIIQVLEYLDSEKQKSLEFVSCINEEEASKFIENATERAINRINDICKQNQGF